MTRLGDAAMARLREVADRPDTEGTRYEALEEIGRGGMGSVWRARDLVLERDVALKVLRAPAPSEREMRRMAEEARILAGLEHPGIVPVHDVGVLPDGRAFYAMKLVRGERLDELARRGAPRPELMRLFAKICETVEFSHSRGVIHRDLKPQNIMIGPFGEVLVMDWGIAKRRSVVDETSAVADEPPRNPAERRINEGSIGATATGTVMGTPGYMAPEQLAGRVDAIDERSDVHALGAILHVLLTGALPKGGAGRATDAARTQGAARDGELPRALVAIARKAAAPDPRDRYPTVRALAEDLARHEAGLPVSAHRESFLERARRVESRYHAAVVLVLVYLLARTALLLVTRR